MEQEAREASAVTRNQNTVYVMSHDRASIPQFLGPLVERIDETALEVQLLVITSDSDVAAMVTATAAKLGESRRIGVLAATSVQRALRLLHVQPAQVLAGTPDTIVDLLRGAAVKLDTVRAVCIAWADELLTHSSAGGDLETLMAELPKDGSRTVVVAETNPEIEELLERYARRARRIAAPVADTDTPVSLEYISVSAHSRLSALRRLLDESDPKSAVVFVRDDDATTEVSDLLRALGYAGANAAIRIGITAVPDTELVVLFDLPASRAELREAVAGAARTVALIQPRQLSSLRALSAGGSLKPIALPDPGTRAREREHRIRAELSAALAKGQFGRELLALEPLLDEYDGIEIAAAALQLLDRARSSRAAVAPPSTPPPPGQRPTGDLVRLFVNVGSRDNVRPADLVGAMSNHAGISSADLGKVDVRESHSIVEVAPRVVETVIENVTGVSIRGRRAVVRRDEERPRRERETERRPRDDARPRGGDRGGDRGDRGGERGADRGAARSGGARSSGGRPPARGGARPTSATRRPPRERE
ncbi:MAG: DbpA RNA binding domain-containing protein [Gemmatimonadaceae bacterium]